MSIKIETFSAQINESAFSGKYVFIHVEGEYGISHLETQDPEILRSMASAFINAADALESNNV